MSRVRVAYTAGEAIGPDLFSFYRSLGINLKQLYGSTETCGVRLACSPTARCAPTRSACRSPSVELKIADSGEVLLSRPGLFKEYYKNPEATAEAKTADGWFHTGDAGYLDGDGHLQIIDRAKDVGQARPTARCSRPSTSRTS